MVGGGGVSLGDAVFVFAGVTDGVPSGVMDEASSTVGVLVGARVGTGAWVGVATSVLPGRAIVARGACVGVGGIVGRTTGTSVVTATGLEKRSGRTA
jgi:hypothetical protein